MDYGTLPTRWKVKEVKPEGNLRFDLQVNDVLELAGGVVRRHRGGSSIDWGSGCTFDPKNLAIKGDHNASAGGAEFLITIKPGGAKATHDGEIGGPGTGGNGTWIAEEGG